MSCGLKPGNSIRISVFFAILLVPAALSANEALLDELRAGNHAALESIHTLYCRVHRSSPVSARGPIAESSGEFWWSGGSRRVRSTVNGQLSDSVVHDFTQRSLAKSSNRNGQEDIRFFIKRAVPDEPHAQFDPWGGGLLKLCGPRGRPLTLEQLLTGPHVIDEVERVVEAGRELILVGLTIELSGGASGRFKIWFDPSVNYLARKLVGTTSSMDSKASNSRRESEVLQFKEAAPTVYIPEIAETRFFQEETLVHHDVFRFTDIRVNQPLPPEIFEISVPPGARVIDSIQDQEYTLDARGNKIGDGRALAKFAPLPAGNVQGEATAEEPKSMVRWLIPASLTVIGAAGALWLFRQWRSSAT
jgi:hypothetical protein